MTSELRWLRQMISVWFRNCLNCLESTRLVFFFKFISIPFKLDDVSKILPVWAFWEESECEEISAEEEEVRMACCDIWSLDFRLRVLFHAGPVPRSHAVMSLRSLWKHFGKHLTKNLAEDRQLQLYANIQVYVQSTNFLAKCRDTSQTAEIGIEDD